MKGQVTDDGVRLGSGRVLGWEQIYFVDWTAKDARLATAAGVVSVSRADGDRAERHLAPWEAERDAWVRETSEQRRLDWAAVTSGKSAVSRQGWGNTLLAAFLWFLALVFMVPAMADGDSAFIAISLFMLAFLGPLAAFVWHRMVGPNILRDADGLRFGGLRPCRMKWVTLRATGERPMPMNHKMSATHLVLLTRHGRLVVKDEYKDDDALRTGLRRAMAEREQAVPANQGPGRFAPSMTRPGQGLWLDDNGLTIVGARAVRRLPWSRLKAPVWTANGPRLDLRGRRLKLTGYLRGETLAHALDTRLAGDEPVVDEHGELRAEAIERWLGVAPGGALRCRLSPALVWGCGLLLLAIVAGFVLILIDDAQVHGNFYQVGLLVAMFVSMLRSARSVDADAQGLSVRRGKKREYFAWSEIEELTQNRNDWSIVTERGTVKLSRLAKGQDRVIGIVRRILAMREQGAALPTSAPTPEVALSLARSRGEVGAERGLSVSAEE